MADDKAIVVSGVKVLRRRCGIAGVNLEIVYGQCVALLGPNGAGKPSPQKSLRATGNETVATLWFWDRSNHGDRRWKSRLGIVLQDARDLADLTVRESVKHFSSYYPDGRSSDDVISAVGLVEKADAKAGQLSGGQRRRLDVALGIVGRPDVLFLDEPTTGFDPEARRQFWELIDALKGEGTTILLTTHYLDEAEHLADRVAVINRGRVLAMESPEALGNRQKSRAVVQWQGRRRPEVTVHCDADRICW